MAAPALRLVPSIPVHTTDDLPVSVFAGFWIRAAATVFDWFLASLISNPMGYFVGQVVAVSVKDGQMTQAQGDALNLGFSFAFAVTLNLAYLGVMQGMTGYTLGKKVFGLRVINQNLESPEWKTGVLRYFYWVLGSIPVYAGFILAAFDPKKRAFHDRWAKTSVVYSERLDRAVAALIQADQAQQASREAASAAVSDRLAA